MSSEHPEKHSRLSREQRLILLVILSVAFGVRLWAILFVPADVVGDASDYHRLATDLARGLGYVNADGIPTAWRPPGYPVFLAAIYVVTGANVRAATVVQALLGTGTVLLIAWLGSLFVSRTVGLIAGAIAAIYPAFFWLPRVLLSENVALFLIVAALIAATLLLRSGKAVYAITLGLALGLGTLVRGATLPVAIMLLAGVAVSAWRHKKLRALVGPALLAGVAFLITLVPWVARNYVVFNRVVLTTQEGFGLYASYWPPEINGKRIWGNLPGNEDPVVEAASHTGNEVAASDYFSAETRRRLTNNPMRAVRLLPEKIISLAAPFDWEWFPHPAYRSRSFNLAYVLLLPFVLAGAWLLWRRRVDDQWVLWIVPISVVLQSVIFYGSPRFRLTAEPVAIVMSAVAISAIYQFWTSRRVA